MALAPADPQLRRRVRRSALLWFAVAAGFYLGFILLTLWRAAR